MRTINSRSEQLKQTSRSDYLFIERDSELGINPIKTQSYSLILFGAINRIMGFLILAIAVQLITDGLIDVIKESAPNLLR